MSSVRDRAFSAIRWTTGASVGRVLIATVQLAVLARLLPPSDFGLLALTLTIVNIAALVSDAGVSSAIIHYQNISPRQLSTLYWLNVSLGISLCAVMASTAPLLADFYSEPRLVGVLRISSLVFIITSFGQQFRALAEKNMRFRDIALVETTSTAVTMLTTIATALSGWGVYALVAGMLAGALVSSALFWTRKPADETPSWMLHISEIWPFLRFGLSYVAVNIANTVAMQMDNVVIGRMFGSQAIGLYSQPRELAMRIMLLINPVITRVGFPLIASNQTDLAVVRSIFLRTILMASSINFPFYGALALLAPEIVYVMLGPNWSSSVELFRAVSVWCLFRSVGNPNGSLLYALGRTRRAFISSTLVAMALTGVVFLGSQWGVVGIPWALAAYYATLIPILWMFSVRPVCRAGFMEYHMQVAIPLTTTTLSVGAAAASIWFLQGEITRLVVGSLVGGVVYLSASWLMNRPWLEAIAELLGGKTRSESSGSV